LPEVVLVQLSDSHIGGAWPGCDPTACLEATLEEIRRMPDSPDAVLVTGDLTDTGADSEYELIGELLRCLALPVYALPGNHDNRDRLREQFGLPGSSGTPVHYAADFGPLRVVALDSTLAGAVGGERDRLAWLDAELSDAPARTTLVAMHHPPIPAGVAAWDEIGLRQADRKALGEVLRHHPQVRRLVAGHVHQAILGDLAGRSVITAPSTCVQAQLSFGSPIKLTAQPPGFAAHTLTDGEITSYVRFVG
jgi:3',5'-cyclic AMP phosphodiesterase CpdA